MRQKTWMILTQELKLFFFANELYKKLQNPKFASLIYDS